MADTAQIRSPLQVVQETLSPCLNPIMVRGVIRSALSRVGISEQDFEQRGLSSELVHALERGLELFCKDNPDARARATGKLRAMVAKNQPRSRSEKRTADEINIEISSEIDIVRARREVRTIARNLGFNTTDETKIATAVSELSRNIFNYAGQGRVTFISLDGARRGLRIKAEDQGPGITDISAIMSGSYRSKTGLGLGLRGCKRLMDQFDITTGPKTGTRITMEKHL